MAENSSVETALSLIQEDPSKILGLKFGSHEVKPGEVLPRAGKAPNRDCAWTIRNRVSSHTVSEAKSAPELSFDVASGTYMVINLDLDAPFPSFNVLSPILHWLQPGLQPQTADGVTKLLSQDTPWMVNYAGPGPPPGSAVHRYIFLLYEQPAAFDPKEWAPPEGTSVGRWNRIRYDLGAFEKKIGLGPVLAANYFCSN
jgi:phosphatidylethanolamine-binding protein